MMECPFQVGQKVVCIADGWVCLETLKPVCSSYPSKNEIFAIKDVVSRFGHIWLDLKEFSPSLWDHRCFRPLQQRPKEADTDISVFYPLLTVKQRETV